MRAGLMVVAALFLLRPPVRAAGGGAGLALPATPISPAASAASPIAPVGPAEGLAPIPEVVGHPVEIPAQDDKDVLWLHSPDFQEEFKGKLKSAEGDYDAGSLEKVDRLMRCKGSGETISISKELLQLLEKIQQYFGGARIEVLCGYRSPERNASLRRHRRGVAKESYHMEGMAADIRISGVPTAKLGAFAASLRAGGVGYYLGRGFIHVDVGPVRTWGKGHAKVKPRPSSKHRRPGRR